MDELIDVVDENNEPMNMIKSKSAVHYKGLWHRTVHVWMFTTDRRILLQLRGKDKDSHPNQWDISVGGHISAGELPIEAALREIKEEISIDVGKDELEFIQIRKNKSTWKQIINNEFNYVYLLHIDIPLNQLIYQKDEIDSLRLVDMEELLVELKIKADEFVPHGNYWQDIVSEIEKRLSR